MRVKVAVEPKMALLRLNRRRRMFQDLTAKDIVTKILSDARIECVWKVHPEPLKRTYCRQEHESDFRFITRLASEEGAHFFFDRKDKKPVVVFTNDPRGYLPMDAKRQELRFAEGEGSVSGEHVRTLGRAEVASVASFAHAAYDFENPGIALLALELADGIPPAVQEQSEVYEYPGRFDDAQKDGEEYAHMRLDELRSNALTLSGTASCLRLAAGKKFTLSRHPNDELNGDLLVTGVVVQGKVDSRDRRGDVALTRFFAVPAAAPIHPAPIPKPEPRVQLAVVVGGKPGDVFTDKFGRVKVQFKWDRDGKFDEHSSCFMRMMTPSANQDEGEYSVHKVGAEVLIDHIDGDIDQPHVKGALFNAREVQPLSLPGDATRGVWKERSIPRGRGYNAIAFENKAGREEISLHAERNLAEHIGHAHSETIGASQTSTVGGPQTITVGGPRSVTVGASETITIVKDRHETVCEKEDVTVKKGRTHTVEEGNDVLHLPNGDREVNVYTGNHTRNVKLLDKTEADNVQAHARYDMRVVGDRMFLVEQGESHTKFEGGHIETFSVGHILIQNKDGSQMLYEAGNVTITAPTQVVIDAPGVHFSMADKKMSVSADTEIELAVGDNAIKISAAGIDLAGAKIKSTATSGTNELTGLMVKLN